MIWGLRGQSGDLLSDKCQDIAGSYFYWRHFAVTSLKTGGFPFWNPHVFCGTPFAANPETALFYPLNLLYLLLPVVAAINVSLLLHLLLGGFFAWLLARRFGLSAWPALLSAITYMLCGPNFARLFAGHLSNIICAAWLPLLLLWVEEQMVNPRIRNLACGSLTLALMILGGHLQYVFFSLVFLAIYVLSRSILSYRARQTGPEREAANEGRGRFRFAPILTPFLGFAAIVFFGFALTGIQLSLTWEMVKESG